MLAAVHVAFPGLAIDAVFLGLLAFAALVLLFDIEKIEWLGVSARRREIHAEREALKELNASEIKVLPPEIPTPRLGTGSDVTDEPPAAEHREAFDLLPPTDRRERLLWAMEQIRIELIVLAASSGHLSERRDWASYSAGALAADMASRNMIPIELLDPILTVVQQRNQFVHRGRIDDSLAESVSSLALEVLAKLRQVQRTYIRVRSSPIEIYRDKTLTTRHSVSGVMLAQLDREGKVLTTLVFPTEYSYQPGRFVSWEWDFRVGTDEEGWYFDSNRDRAVMAWSSAAGFAGREFPEQWGLKWRLPNPDRGLD